MKTLKNLLVSCAGFLFLLTGSFVAKADHEAAGDLTYKCLGNGQYEITFTMYRDCAGASGKASDFKSTITSASGCGTVTPNFTEISRYEVAYPCPTAQTNCNGGTVKALQAIVFKATVTLSASCKDWVVKITNGSNRNCAITTTVACGGFFGSCNGACLGLAVSDSMFTISCNNSAQFINKPVLYACVGQPICFNAGATDSDGDSLVYEFTPPLSTGVGSPPQVVNGQIQYQAPYSYTNFLSSSTPITIDRNTGEVCFTPTKIEVTIAAVRVFEYRNGVKVGSMERDMEIWVIDCNNNLPTASGINGTNSFSTSVCAGQQLCFNVNTNDADAGQTVSIVANTFPGATFTSAGSPHPTGTFCWTPGPSDVRTTPYLLTLIVNDNNCPLQGTRQVTYSIYVNSCGFTANVTGGSVCPGACTTVTASASGGTAPYTYSWSNGLAATAGPHTVCPVSATTYTVTITDNTGASSSSTGSVTMNTPATLSTTKTDALCFGGNTGSATVTPNGGTSPFTYQWTGVSGSTFQVSGLSAGTYTVTATDNKGCTSTATILIGEPQDISVNGSTFPSGCGQSNGSVTVTASGGSGGYTYQWSQGGSGSILSAVSAGTYTVTVTDNKGCTKTSTLSVGSTGATTATITGSTNASCSTTNNGSATATGGGGTSPYTFSWSGGGGTTSAAGNLSAGTYTVTVTDATGCPATASVTITSPAAMTLTTSKTDANCGGSDGSATVAVVGGSGSYTYQWSQGGSTQAAVSNLSSGTYTVTVTDVNGCTNTAAVAVNDIGSPSLNVSSVNVTCNGASTGSITSSVTGGVSPYTYIWSSGQNTSNVSNVSAGTYTLTVRGQNGCSAQQVVTITEPSSLNLSTTKADASCGKSNGSVTVTAAGGSGSYTYQWSGGSTQAAVSNISAGNYTVTVTDNNGCSRTAAVSVADIGSPSVTVVKTDNVCYNAMNGSATATPSGGVQPYTYQWSGGSGSTQSAVGSLGAGTYTVTVTGNNGCTVTTTVTINQPQDISLSITNTDELCGSQNGTATVTSSGGSGSYTYQWTGGSTQPAISNLSAGNYSVTVTDANACTKIISTSVQSINTYGPQADFTMDPNETEILAPTIRFTDLSGGAATWDWNFGDGDSSIMQNPTHTYGDTGLYTVCLNITNQYGCASQTCKAVTIKPIWSLYIPNAFTPDGDGKNELFLPQGMGIQTYELYIFDRWGDLQFKSTSITNGWNGKANNGVDAVEEDVYVYLVLVTDINKKQHRYTGSVTVVK